MEWFDGFLDYIIRIITGKPPPSSGGTAL